MGAKVPQEVDFSLFDKKHWISLTVQYHCLTLATTHDFWLQPSSLPSQNVLNRVPPESYPSTSVESQLTFSKVHSLLLVLTQFVLSKMVLGNEELGQAIHFLCNVVAQCEVLESSSLELCISNR